MKNWLTSDVNYICWTRQSEKSSRWEFPQYSNYKQDISRNLRREPGVTWFGPLNEFGVFEQTSPQAAHGSLTVWLIPFWYVTIPLSLLSAWLLLRKPATTTTTATPPAPVDYRGRWKVGTAYLLFGCLAQAIMWAYWWDNPSYFKMSVLFVWPAVIIAIGIWWTFFSGWSSFVRWGFVSAIVVPVIAVLALYRMEWDGDMVPRRFVLLSIPAREELTREFLKQAPTIDEGTAVSVDKPGFDSAAVVESEGDWPGFRGRHRDGIVQNGSLRRNWDVRPPREIWRHPVGRAWSSFAIVGTYAFTQEQRGQDECVVAYDVDTGAQRWVHADEAMLSIVAANGGPGPHATPQFDDGLIYSLGGTGLLNCLQADSGKVVWSTDILKDEDGKPVATQPSWGVSFSPLIVDDLVIVVPGGSVNKNAAAYNRGVVAYEKKTGAPRWASGMRSVSYGSPRIETIGGVRQILVPNGNGLSGHSLESGEEYWFFPLENFSKINTAMPWLVDTDSLLFGTGYGVGTVRLDIKHQGGKWSVEQRWASNRLRPKFNDFIVRDGFAYGLDDGRLCCLDVKTGSMQWRAARYGYGQLLLVDDVLMVISEDGELALIPAEPEKRDPLATMKIFDSGFCWNHLALARGRLLARNANEAVCLDVGETQDIQVTSDTAPSQNAGG